MIRTIPSYARKRFTVQDGKPETIVSAASESSNVFELSDLGSGPQLSRLRSNGRDWFFANKAPFAVKLYNPSGNGGAGAIETYSGSIFASKVINFQTATTFRLTYTLIVGLSTTVVIDGTLNSDGGLELDVVTSLDAAAFPGYGIWATGLTFAVKPYEVPTKSKLHLVAPNGGGFFIRDATVAASYGASAQVLDYGGSQIPHPETTATSPMNYQMVSLWHEPSRSTLAVRTNEATARPVRYEIHGDGSNALVTVWHFSESNLGSVSDGSHCKTVLRPIAGDWHDAAEWYRGRLVAESHPAVSRVKIKDMTGAVAHISPRVVEADHVFYMSVSAYQHAHPPTLAEYQRARDEIVRVRNFVGTSRKLIVHWYNWHPNANDSWPDMFPPVSDFTTVFNEINALSNVSQIVYTYPSVVDPDTTFYTGNSGDSLAVLTSTQGFRLSTDANLGSTHRLLQLGNATARTLYKDRLKTLTTHIAAMKGVYFDTLANHSHPDYRTSLTAQQKGPGSNYYKSGQRSLMTLIRDEFKTTQGISDWIQAVEFGDEPFVDLADWGGNYVSNYPFAVDYFMPLFAVIFSQYQRFFAYGSVDTIHYLTGWTTDYDVYGFILESQFHAAMIPGWSYQGLTPNAFCVQDPSDSDYAALSPYSVKLTSFQREMIHSLTDENVRAYHRGRRLRPLAGSPEDLIGRNGIVSMVSIGAPFPGAVTGALVLTDVASSVWFSEETGFVGIVLTNRHYNDRVFQIRMDTQSHPDIAGGVRYLVSNSGGTRTLLKTFFGAVIYTASVPALSVVLLEVVATPP